MKLKTSMNLVSALLIAAVCLSSQLSSAGEILRMKSGNYSLQSNLHKNLQEQGISLRADEIYFNSAKRTFVIQFKNHISSSDRSALSSMGIEPKAYLPDDAYVVVADPSVLEEAALLPNVRTIHPYENEWKTSPELLIEKGPEVAEPFVVSTFDEGQTPVIAAQLRAIPGIRIKMSRAKTIILTSDRSRIGEMAQIDGVEWIEPLQIMVTFDLNEESEQAPPPPLNGYESGTKVMNFDTAWARGYHGENQIAAMADTGMDTGDLATMNTDLSAVLKGYIQGYNAKGWEDSVGHGTHVSGSVIGNGGHSGGILKGGAYAARFLAVGLWSPLASSLMFKQDFDLIVGLTYSDGARIHTNSWGSTANLGVYDSNASKIDTFMWENPDILVLFAAGNSGADRNKDGRIDENSISSPGTAKNVLTVGASENLLPVGGIQKPHGSLNGGATNWSIEPIKSDTPSNNPNGMACFSSRGPTKDGRIKPEIVAPGTNIVSVRSSHPKALPLWGAYNDYYTYSGGTSMATPLTAGAATVVRQYLTEGLKIQTPSAALMKAVLIHTATDMYPGQYGEGPTQELPTRRPNVHEGFGRVDMDFATRLDGALVVDEKEGLASDQAKTYQIHANAGQKLIATLSYTDYPGSAAAAKALVNDLALEVTAPSGEKVARNDHTNNSRMIEMENTVAGDYTVTVRSVNVPAGKKGTQPFALVVTVR